MQDDNDRRDSASRRAAHARSSRCSSGPSTRWPPSQASLLAFRGETLGQLYDVQQQLLQVQELTGQSTRRLNELRGELDARGEQLGGAAPGAPASGRREPPRRCRCTRRRCQQLRRGSPTTARAGFRQILEQYPTASRGARRALLHRRELLDGDPRLGGGLLHAGGRPSIPTSPRAASALYRLGCHGGAARDTTAARGYYQRLIAKYPTSNEAALARDRLKALGR